MEDTVAVTDDAIRQMVRNILKTPSLPCDGEKEKEGAKLTVPDQGPPISPKEPEINESDESTLQEVVDTLKKDQESGFKLARGERKLKETAAPSSAKSIEVRALEKYKKVFTMLPHQRQAIIAKAAKAFENSSSCDKTKLMYESLPDDAKRNVDRWVIEDYKDTLIRTGELNASDIALLKNGTVDVKEAILQLEGYRQYRDEFWNDVKEYPSAWLFFDDFKVFMKPYWDGKVK